MDYMVLSTLRLSGRDINEVCLLYDISCTFSRNFTKRLERYSDLLQIGVRDLRIKWAIPKFYIWAHGMSCQLNYNFGYMRGAGRTHGESIETGWAEINPAALSTREMSNAFRHETLDDIMGAINWSKLLGMGKCSIHFIYTMVLMYSQN